MPSFRSQSWKDGIRLEAARFDHGVIRLTKIREEDGINKPEWILILDRQAAEDMAHWMLEKSRKSDG